jgi:hypothetical protein
LLSRASPAFLHTSVESILKSGIRDLSDNLKYVR